MANNYSVDSSGNIYKNNTYVPASNYNYLQNDPAGQQALANAKQAKTGGTTSAPTSASRDSAIIAESNRLAEQYQPSPQPLSQYEQLAQISQQQPQQQPTFDIGSILAQLKQQAPPPAPTLSLAEAQQRAQMQLNPMYDEAMQQSLRAVDKSNMQRGFFGQLPGAALSRSTAADVESRKAQAIGQLTNELIGQSEGNAQALQSLAMQQRGQDINAILGSLNAQQAERDSQRRQAEAYAKYYLDTEADRQNRQLEWTQTMGQTPGATSGAVSLRDYVQSQGATLGYDAATKDITVNGKRYSRQQLEQLGGRLVDGSWYLPQSLINGLL